MRATIWVILLAMVASGCSVYSDQDVILIASNYTSDSATVIVDGIDRTQIAPGGTTNITTDVKVPRNQVGTGSFGPSIVDKTVSVKVEFRNLRTGRLAGPVYCSPGAKVKMSVVYEVFAGRERVTCTEQW